MCSNVSSCPASTRFQQNREFWDFGIASRASRLDRHTEDQAQASKPANKSKDFCEYSFGGLFDEPSRRQALSPERGKREKNAPRTLGQNIPGAWCELGSAPTTRVVFPAPQVESQMPEWTKNLRSLCTSVRSLAIFPKDGHKRLRGCRMTDIDSVAPDTNPTATECAARDAMRPSQFRCSIAPITAERSSSRVVILSRVGGVGVITGASR